MTRLASLILLVFCCRDPVAAQSEIGNRPVAQEVETAPVALLLAANDSASPPAPGDRPMDGNRSASGSSAERWSVQSPGVC